MCVDVQCDEGQHQHRIVFDATQRDKHRDQVWVMTALVKCEGNLANQREACESLSQE